MTRLHFNSDSIKSLFFSCTIIQYYLVLLLTVIFWLNRILTFPREGKRIEGTKWLKEVFQDYMNFVN